MLKEERMNPHRNSAIEFLRILSMLTIVGVHYWGACHTTEIIERNDNSYMVLKMLQVLCSYGVDIFVIITGYYMIGRTFVNIRKVFDLIWEIAFYGAILYCLSIQIGINTFTLPGLIKAVFPFLIGLRWFVKAYIILFLLIPFINKVLNAIDKKAHLSLASILLILFSLWPFILPYPPMDDYGFSFNNFIVIYVIAAYIRKYVYEYDVKWCVWAFFISTLLSYFLMVLPDGGGIFSIMKVMVLAHNSPLQIVACFSLFMLFLKMEWHNRYINMLAASAFSVYVIHGEFNIMQWMFAILFRGNQFQYGWVWLLHWFGTILIVYIVCFIIDSIVKSTILRIFSICFDECKYLNLTIKC